MESKIFKSIKIKKVTAYPLNKKGECFHDGYSMGISNGAKLLPTRDDLVVKTLKDAAKEIMKWNRLSYAYKSGDITCFVVKYQLDSKSGTKQLTFVTKKSDK